MDYRPTLILYALVLIPFSSAVSEPVFTWVDQEGVTHFSESPPEDDSVQPTQLEILPPTAADSGIVDDYYSVANQAERMEARRLERLEAAAARFRAEADAIRAAAEARAAEQAADNEYTDSTHYYPLPAYPYHPGHRRPLHRRKPHISGHSPEPGHWPHTRRTHNAVANVP